MPASRSKCALGQRADERVLRREVAVDRPDADARAARDVLDLGFEPRLGERGRGGREDPLPVAPGIRAQRLGDGG